MSSHNAAQIAGRVVPLRLAILSDASEIARLLTQLGHATTQAQVEQRWAEWAGQGNSALVAVGNPTQLLGLCQLHQTVVLHRPRPVGRITALVVEESHRGLGLGRALVATAETHLLSAGCGLIEITSNMRRTDAHAFYERLGYVKTSVRLAKDMTTTAG